KGAVFGLNFRYPFSEAFSAEATAPAKAPIKSYGGVQIGLENLHQAAPRGITGPQAVHDSRDRADVMLIAPERLVRKNRTMSSIGRESLLLARQHPAVARSPGTSS